MKQTSNLTRTLAVKQERNATTGHVLFRIYTEDKPNLLTLVARYFDGATLTNAVGVYDGGTELSKIIDIVGRMSDTQKVFDLAGDIRELNAQTSVLLTLQRVSVFSIGAPEHVRPLVTADDVREVLAVRDAR